MLQLALFLQAAQQATESLQSRIIDAAVSAAIGGVLALAAFRSRLDRHTDALTGVKEQRKEDRAADQAQRAEDREADREARLQMRKDFSELCTNLDASRKQEMQFIQRQVENFQRDQKQSERRQLHILDLQTAIARKLDIRHRLTDAITWPIVDDDNPHT